MFSPHEKTTWVGFPNRVVWAACLAAVVCCCQSTALPAAEAPSPDLLQLIGDLVGDADKEMRAIGLQQVRAEVPGAAATGHFVQLLPKLRPEARAELIDALGERGDPAARAAVLDAAQGPDEAVRSAALRALAKLGTEADVPLLVPRTAAGPDGEQQAARQSLIQLKGDGVNRALTAQVGPAPADVRVQLLAILAARNAVESLPAVVAAASAPDAPVRLAALDALRVLADDRQTGDVVKLLQNAASAEQRTKAEATLLALCGRGRENCVPALAASLDGADGETRVTLLQALARAGGAAALESVASCLVDADQTVQDEAVRMLSSWPDRAVVPHLEKLAGEETLRHHVLAVRGLIRLASPEGERPADLRLLGQSIRAAKRRDEKQLGLGVLGRVVSLDALALAVSLLDDPQIAEDAGWTAGLIAEGLPAGNQDAIRAALRQVLDRTRTPKPRAQAEKVLGNTAP